MASPVRVARLVDTYLESGYPVGTAIKLAVQDEMSHEIEIPDPYDWDES